MKHTNNSPAIISTMPRDANSRRRLASFRFCHVPPDSSQRPRRHGSPFVRGRTGPARRLPGMTEGRGGDIISPTGGRARPGEREQPLLTTGGIRHDAAGAAQPTNGPRPDETGGGDPCGLATGQRDQLALHADEGGADAGPDRGEPGGTGVFHGGGAVHWREEAGHPDTEHGDDGIR